MKILTITTCGLFPRGTSPNAGIFFANLLLRLAGLADKVAVVAPRPYVPKPVQWLPRWAEHRHLPFRDTWRGIPVYRPAYFSVRSRRLMWTQARSFTLAALPLCEALHRRHKFDIVLGGEFAQCAHAANCAAQALGLRSVNWAVGSDVHTVPNLSQRNLRLFRHNVTHSHLVLATSRALACQIQTLAPGARHVHTFYRGTDLSYLRSLPDGMALRKRLGLDPDAVYMISMGRLTALKGCHEFYEAFRRLAPRHPRLSAIWVGDGPQGQTLRKQARQDGLQDSLTITGFVPHPEALRYLRCADVLAFASHIEGLPNTVMEAMAAELPVVATDAGGTRELVLDSVTGRLIPVGDTEALVAGVQSVLERPVGAASMARTARQYILNYFDVYKNAKTVLSVFESVLAGKPPADPLPSSAGVPPGRLPIEMLRGSVP